MQQRTYKYNYEQQKAYRPQSVPQNVAMIKPKQTIQTNKKKKNVNKSFGQKIALLAFSLLFFSLIFPHTYKQTTKSILINPYTTRHIKFNANDFYNKTVNVFNNEFFLGKKFLVRAENKKPQMQSIYLASEILPLTKRLNAIAKNYPTIEPTVFVWDFETGNWAGIEPEKLYSAASIIKIPVLIELFKSVENGEMKLEDKITLTDYYRAEGSGNLQYQKGGNQYTLDNLARVMIENSDNSATNMLIAKMGSMVDINRSIRKWGLKNTYIQNWLPDLKGTNYTTAKDLATMLYNIDNPSFLTLSSREKIVDYMSHVKNDRLLKAGLPADAAIIHKTGDIGKTLGDAGIIYAPNGRKFIVVVMANRPYNSHLGKDYIIETSSAIYNYMVNGQQ